MSEDAGDEDPAAIAASEAVSRREIEGVASWGGARALALAAAWHSSLHDSTVWAGGRSEEPLSRDPQVLAWQQEAARLAGDDPVANTLLLRAGGEIQRQAAARWARAEPANLAPWRWLGLSAHTLAQILPGRSRYDLHRLEIRRMLLRARREFPPTAEEYALLFGKSRAMRPEWLPVLSCHPDWLFPGFFWPTKLWEWAGDRLDPHGVALRRRSAEILQSSDSPGVRSLGLDMALRLGGDDPAIKDQLERLRGSWRRADAFAKAEPDAFFPLYARLLDDPAVRTEAELDVALDRLIGQCPDPMPARTAEFHACAGYPRRSRFLRGCR
jgi:hypothetical protein